MSASDSLPVIDSVVSVHAQEAVSLAGTRLALLGLPHVDLHAIARLDERLVAHFDGLAVAGPDGRKALDAESAPPSTGSAFVTAVRAIENREPLALEPLWLSASEDVVLQEALVAAFSWVDRRYLQGIVRELLDSPEPAKCVAGLMACTAHGVDPGLEKSRWLEHEAPPVRTAGVRAVGALGLTELAPRCAKMTADSSPECALWAASSAVLLGIRGPVLDELANAAITAEGAHRARALPLALQAMSLSTAHLTLQRLGGDQENLRWLIQGSGVNGDPRYVPWLIRHMTNASLARLAGESFTLITGADLDALQLWRARPENFESGPTDNPDDEDVSMDPDEGLMWPDPEKVTKWWEKNANRFQHGQRYFIGAPVTREHCINVLKNGYQRQRILAAHYLCLLNPGTPLFNTSAPAWRQQRLLASMS